MSSARAVVAVAALALLAAGPRVEADARAADADLLNSERIEQRFGSYGVQVLESGPRLRISNLFSGGADERIGRTFAVVTYPATINPRLEREHGLILAGGSIGAVLAAHGWRVDKTHLYYGELDSGPRVERLMGGLAPTKLAVHVYALDAVRDDARIRYAVLAEVHHPDYLRLEDLVEIYGEVAIGGETDAQAVAELLARTAEALR